MSSAAGEALGLDPELMSDINTAVSEACNNVIEHAYSGEPGPFSVASPPRRLGSRYRFATTDEVFERPLPITTG